MTRINTNVQSLIARRALGTNNVSLNQALERLSTGLRINSGKDDPAGLIASESLRSNMRAITAAIDNATRADTVVAIAEGGLQEISALMLELESLIDQSANTAGLTQDELNANQQQIDSILASIDRIADSTAFGSKKLLNGTMDFVTSGVNINESTGATVDQLDNVQINGAKIAAGAFKQVNVNVVAGSEFAVLSATLGGTDGTTTSATTIQITGSKGTDILSFASGTTAANVVAAINSSSQLTGVSAVLSGAGTAGSPYAVALTSTAFGADAFVTVDVLENASTFSMPGGASDTDEGVDGTITINGANAVVKGLDVSVRTGVLSADLTLSQAFGTTDGGAASFEITSGGATFAISPDVGLTGLETLGIQQVSSGQLGTSGNGFLSSLKTGQTNDLNSSNFTTAQEIVRKAINQVASLRGRLGAFQSNTLQSTINSLRIAQENVTAAESAIRDADFAAETASLTRAQILVNSSTAALQIANAQPQNALALLG